MNFISHILQWFSSRTTCEYCQACSGHWDNGICMATCLSAAQVLQSCPTLCGPVDCSPPGSSVHRILQGRILEWVAMPSSRGSSCFLTQGSNLCLLCLLHCRQILYSWATREAPYMTMYHYNCIWVFKSLWSNINISSTQVLC